MQVKAAARHGEMNHDMTILPSFSQLRPLAPVATRPAPRSAPVTVCVPEIGMPKNVLHIRNMNEVRQTENIMEVCWLTVSSAILGMIFLLRVAATSSEQNMAPMKTAMEPRPINFIGERAFEP